MAKDAKNVGNKDVKNKKTESKKFSDKAAAKQASAKAVPKQAVQEKKASPNIVGTGHLVYVEYTGTLDNGEEFDSSKNHGPIKFIVGGSQVIK